MTSELFFLSCKNAGLDISDLELMTVGMCMDFIAEYVAMKNPKAVTREANQSDFDKF